MTRINVVPVEELSDQWLLAEYRELPRVIKGEFDLRDAPDNYCLGKGHVKWAKKYSFWLLYRYDRLLKELKYRGFRPKHSLYELVKTYGGDSSPVLDYYVSDMDIEINRERLIEKYRMKPDFYRWTNRIRPDWLKNDEDFRKKFKVVKDFIIENNLHKTMYKSRTQDCIDKIEGKYGNDEKNN